jgi:hypothetical protein
VLAAVVLLAASPASAQSTPLVRGDVSGTLGIQSVDARAESFYGNRRFEAGFFGGISGGWYWTEHLKTEIDFGARTKGRIFEPSPIVISGVQTYSTTERTFWRHTLGLGQQYQFFHNAWFHPHLGAGTNLTWERSRLHATATVMYDPQTRTSRTVTPDHTDNIRTQLVVNPFVESGFKAYMTPRTFFRSDLRVAFHRDVDDVMMRFGFGFDF